MKPLPENILSKMEKKDRAGQLTKEEAERQYESGQEKILQKLIAEYLRMRGVYYYQAPFGRKTSTTGTADFLCAVGGRWLSIEAKARTGKQSPDQVKDQSAVEKSGGAYCLARSLQDVISALQFTPDK